jgi:hypothetical protein
MHMPSNRHSERIPRRFCLTAVLRGLQRSRANEIGKIPYDGDFPLLAAGELQFIRKEVISGFIVSG